MLGTVLDGRDSTVSKTDRFYALMEILFASGRQTIRSK